MVEFVNIKHLSKGKYNVPVNRDKSLAVFSKSCDISGNANELGDSRNRN